MGRDEGTSPAKPFQNRTFFVGVVGIFYPASIVFTRGTVRPSRSGTGGCVVCSSGGGVLRLMTLLVRRGVGGVILYPNDHGSPVMRAVTGRPFFSYCPIASRQDTTFFTVKLTLRNNDPTTIYYASNDTLLGVRPTMSRTFCRRIPLIMVSTSHPKT